MPGVARVAGAYKGRVTFVAIDIGPFVGLGDHATGQRQLAITGTTYPAAYAVDSSALTQYGVYDTTAILLFDAGGHLVRKAPEGLSEGDLRRQVAALAGS
jgi:hypothetical protein